MNKARQFNTPVETGSKPKEWGRVFRTALVYPNVYRVGMGNLGLHAVYRSLNGTDGFLADRFFHDPAHGKKPMAVERPMPPGEYDCIAFTVHFEPDYPAIPAFLNAAAIKTRSSRRTDGDPIVIAGGPSVSANPEPLAEFVDAVFIGEYEGGGLRLFETLKDLKSGGATRCESLETIATLPHVYVPSLARFSYDGSRTTDFEGFGGQILPVTASRPPLKGIPPPSTVVYTNEAEFSDMHLVELSRGCSGGCRFCMAGFRSRPFRTFEAARILSAAMQEHRKKIGLVGELFADHPMFVEMAVKLLSSGYRISPSSLRLESLTGNVLEILVSSGQRSLTLAPETPSRRLSRAINKPFDRELFFHTIEQALNAGMRNIKLYFMTGFPCELDSDIDETAALVRETAAMCGLSRGKTLPGSLSVSMNPFIPKPWTPLQWESFEQPVTTSRRIERLAKIILKTPGVEFRPARSGESYWDAMVSRSDRRVGDLIEKAATAGWKSTIKSASAEDSIFSDFAFRRREPDEIFPWETVNQGCTRKYLAMENRRYFEAVTTPRCEPETCRACGACN